ncbi:hypothetical protein [Escherichia sp. 93.1518]|uniref:hypothetical protein n=1 Tax=Escherichia sp. 93.1518 TaxID=2723311 RepID=UPI001593E5D0|nr:hypothetical protein [Escherichia sp. 93.1518]EEV9040760.1 hypothetical protein [Escherichia coli]EEY3925966.1 hypothetical protein [Escherichia coli]EJK6817979.1 hypothetical protein [Escherichia coli]EKN5810979.1 hypothetical protein [Escherichia coli]MBB2318485.1 hypothetical protein [Escherichia sp. 93.1518]
MTKHVVTMEGDNSGLRKSTNQAIDMLDNLADKASKLDFSGGLSSLGSSLRGLGGSASLAVGGVLGVTGAMVGLIKVGADYVKQYSEVSKATGLSIESLQRLEKEFSGTGLTVEKFGDINKDTLDKMGDAWANGGGIADDLESVGLKLENYAHFMTDPQGGMKAAIQVFYDMKKAGKSMAEIKFMMESLASDSSHMTSQLEKYNNAQEAMTAIQNQSVKVTEENAKKFDKFSQNIDKLENNMKGAAMTISGPLVDSLNWLFDWFNIDWEKSSLFKALDRLNKEGATATGGILNANHKDAQKIIDKYNKEKRWNNLADWEKAAIRGAGVDPRTAGFDVEGFKKRFGNSYKKNGSLIVVDAGEHLTTKSSGSLTLPNKPVRPASLGQSAEEKKAEEEKRKKAEEAAKKAKEAAEKAQKEREDAIKRLNALNVKLQGQTAASISSQNSQLESSLKDVNDALKLGVISQEEAAAKRQALIDQNAANVYKMVLGADPVDALNALTQLQQIRDNELESHKRLLDGKAISYEEYMRRVNDTEQSYSQIEESLQGMDGFKTNQLTNGLDYQDSNNPFAKFNAIDKEKSEAEQDYKTDKLKIDGITDPAKRMEALEKLNENHQKRMAAIEKKYADARQSIADDMYGGFAAAMTLFGQENTKAMQMAFNAHKAFSIGQATVNMWTAATDAWNDPTNVTTGQKIAAAALAVSQNMGNIANIKSTNVSGMAHDGIDNIPREGTWLLDKGERVVDQRTNGDLKDFLASQKSGGGNSQPIEVHAPLTIQGNVNSADKMVMEAIKRHAKLVAQTVEDAQRRRM